MVDTCKYKNLYLLGMIQQSMDYKIRRLKNQTLNQLNETNHGRSSAERVHDLQRWCKLQHRRRDKNPHLRNLSRRYSWSIHMFSTTGYSSGNLNHLCKSPLGRASMMHYLLPLPYTIWPVTVKAHGPIQRSALEQCAVWVEEIQPSEVEYDPGPHKAQRLPPAVLSTCAIKPDQYARDPTWQRSKLILGWKFSVRMVAFQRFWTQENTKWNIPAALKKEPTGQRLHVPTDVAPVETAHQNYGC